METPEIIRMLRQCANCCLPSCESCPEYHRGDSGEDRRGFMWNCGELLLEAAERLESLDKRWKITVVERDHARQMRERAELLLGQAREEALDLRKDIAVLNELLKKADSSLKALRAWRGMSEPVVHAHWVRLTPDQRPFLTPGYTHGCSKCGAMGYKHYKRCYDCGAIMDEKVIEPTPLIRLDLGGRINKRLRQMGVRTVEDLEAMDKHTLHNIPGLGRRSIETIESELRIWKRMKENVDG